MTLTTLILIIVFVSVCFILCCRVYKDSKDIAELRKANDSVSALAKSTAERELAKDKQLDLFSKLVHDYANENNSLRTALRGVELSLNRSKRKDVCIHDALCYIEDCKELTTYEGKSTDENLGI